MTTHRVIARLAAASVFVLLPACSSSQNTGDDEVTTITINEGERVAEARRLAARAQSVEKPEEAVRLYQRAVGAWSDFPAAWNNLGILHLDEGRYLDAAEAFLQASERSANDPRPLYNLGLTWERTRHLREAADHYALALERDPRYLPALRGVIHARDRLGEGDETTLERLRHALMQEPDPQWREYFEMRKITVEAELSEQ